MNDDGGYKICADDDGLGRDLLIEWDCGVGLLTEQNTPTARTTKKRLLLSYWF